LSLQVEQGRVALLQSKSSGFDIEQASSGQLAFRRNFRPRRLMHRRVPCIRNPWLLVHHPKPPAIAACTGKMIQPRHRAIVDVEGQRRLRLATERQTANGEITNEMRLMSPRRRCWPTDRLDDQRALAGQMRTIAGPWLPLLSRPLQVSPVRRHGYLICICSKAG
jgi:hypothetical protein